MFNAEYAQELSTAPYEQKWYDKIYLVWAKGRINKAIEKAVNKKQRTTHIWLNRTFGERSRIHIEQYYKSLGYDISIDIYVHNVRVYIFW